MRRCHQTGTAVLGLTLLIFVSATDPGAVEVISPPANAVLPEAPFYVISKGGLAELSVDGRSQSWEPYAGPVHAARLVLKPGPHEIGIGNHRIAVLVKDGNALKTEGLTWLHPIQAGLEGCSACHQTSGHQEQTVVGSVDVAGCLQCHKPAQFETKHSHSLEPLKHCASCHAPHGSPYQGLLKAPAKKLCAACHDS